MSQIVTCVAVPKPSVEPAAFRLLYPLCRRSTERPHVGVAKSFSDFPSPIILKDLMQCLTPFSLKCCLHLASRTLVFLFSVIFSLICCAPGLSPFVLRHDLPSLFPSQWGLALRLHPPAPVLPYPLALLSFFPHSAHLLYIWLICVLFFFSLEYKLRKVRSFCLCLHCYILTHIKQCFAHSRRHFININKVINEIKGG